MKKTIVALGIVTAIVLAGIGTWYITHTSPAVPEKPESIAVGTMLYEYSGLMFIADDRNFFAENGLNVTLHPYVSTVASIKGLEEGDTDITTVPEYSIVTEAFNDENISILGNIDKYQSVYLAYRPDRGIKEVSDLKGRRIGASQGTIGEFYLGRFLILHGMRMQDVALTYLPTTQYVDAIANDSLDAVVVVYKYLEEGRGRLGDNLSAWPIQGGQSGFVVLACRNDWAASHPETIVTFLKSLRQAEEYTLAHPSEAREIVRHRMNYSEETVAAIWLDHQFSLTLDQSLMTAMEDEARWMIAHNLTNATEVPDFRRHVNADGLDVVKPGSVYIIR